MRMNRIHNVNLSHQPNYQEFCRKMAIHEAGHAAAIYLNNKAKGLAPVYFHIKIDLPKANPGTAVSFTTYPNYKAQIEGGRLIQNLPSSLAEITQGLSMTQKHAYHTAFEADIINILAGPLAEAKYVAIRDDEIFNSRLVNLSALQYYGGSQDLQIVQAYLDCFDHQTKEAKSKTLFMEAYEFVNHPLHWQAICRLTQHLLHTGKNHITYDEVVHVLDEGMDETKAPSYKYIFGR